MSVSIVHCKIDNSGKMNSTISGKFTATKDRTLFIVGQDFDTVNCFVNEVLPNPYGTTSYTTLHTEPGVSLWCLDENQDYGAGVINATAQMALTSGESALSLGLSLVHMLEYIVQNK